MCMEDIGMLSLKNNKIKFHARDKPKIRADGEKKLDSPRPGIEPGASA